MKAPMSDTVKIILADNIGRGDLRKYLTNPPKDGVGVIRTSDGSMYKVISSK